MKTDVYTKTVLTIIAGALILIAFQNTDFFPKANASKSTAAFAAIPLNPDGSINVKFTETMKVNVAEVGGNYIYGAMPINIKELSGSSINSSYGIPVNIEAVDGSSIYGAVPTKEKN
ncbi:MAG: hypothetical protein HY841_01975 [Bacteroidetes bacterium]|nr:hypothetical protein [Bacteroidota bacterium]